MEALRNIFPAMGGGSAPMSDADKLALERKKVQAQADTINKAPGNYHADTGYHCPLCNDNGMKMVVVDEADGWPRLSAVPCKCVKTRSSLLKMRASGLGDIIREKTFGKFETPDEWRVNLKKAAMAYANTAVADDTFGGWFFMGGQPGSGKSHLGAAICRELLLKQREVYYMVWPTEVKQLHGLAKADDGHREREKLLDRIKGAEVLYIDDLFKPVQDRGQKLPPTPADVRLAFEIINERYNSPKLLTIISSEWSTDELLGIDEATGSRIFERAQVINIAPDMSRNYRLRKAVTV